ncbi:MAG: outer membrane lipoprotein-sorting protein [Acidobacteriota bacterium]|nr:outer membrane lipoprotein-sorting protein [Acidobacteriota bacterium]
MKSITVVLLTILAAGGASAADDPEVQALLVRMDDLYRGTASSHGKMTMRVKTNRFQREISMEMWSEGAEKSLIRILGPARDRGTATLKADQNIWNYLPKVDRTIKVPVAMMSGSWMGSHLSNDDLVDSSRFSEDFQCHAVQKSESKQGFWLLECVPNEDAVVVYSKTTLKIRANNEIATEVTDYDERGNPVRTMMLSEIDEISGRLYPRHIRMVPNDKPGEYTEMIYDEMEFDVRLPEDTFTLRSLKK